jgi:6-phosphogluconolactonase (cycloisomerase 2 family)
MNRWVERVAAALGIWTLFLTTGCGTFFIYPGNLPGGGSSSTGDYVYVANANTSTVAGFVVGTGTLTAVSGSPYALGFVPTAVVVNPANTIVLVAGSNGVFGFINAYSIGSGGTLSLLKSNNLGAAGEVSIDVSPDGNWLVGLDANGPALNEVLVDEYQINASTGQLTLATGGSYTFPTGTATIVPSGVRFAPNADYVFVAAGTAGDVEFTFNTNGGALASNQRITLASGFSDNAVTVSANSSYLYAARSGSGTGGAAGLAAYTIGSGGVLTSASGTPIAAGNQPFSVVVNNAGTDVYVANQIDGTISGYSVGSAGALTQLSGSPYTSGSQVDALAIDNSKTYLLATARNSSADLTMYSFDSSVAGKLDPSTTATTGNGTEPAGAIAIATTH